METGLFQNPAAYTDGKRYTNPDPYVIRHGGQYYCYSTGEQGVQVSQSANLVHWSHHGFALADPAYHNYWAPSVLYHHGMFYMYYSCTPAGEEDCHEERLRLAVSPSPLGPFRYQCTLFDTFSIDAHVVEVQGKVWMFYSTNDVAGTDERYAGTCILVDRLLEMDTPEGRPAPVLLPSLAQERFAENRFGDGRDWYTIEGAFFFTRQGQAYLMYSANAYVNTDYFVGYARAALRDDLREMQWEKAPNNHTCRPLIAKTPFVEGTGHNSVICAPNLVDPWVVYHGRYASEAIQPQAEQRMMRLDPLQVLHHRLLTPAPSHEPQPCPAHPQVEARKTALRQRYLAEGRWEWYVAEYSLWAERQHTGTRYGVLLCYIDEQNHLEAQWHSGLRNLQIWGTLHGVRSLLASAPLPGGYSHQVLHTAKVTRRFSRFTLELDGAPLLSVCWQAAPGSVGLWPHFTTVHLEHMALTRHILLQGEELAEWGRLYACEGGFAAGADGLLPRAEAGEATRHVTAQEGDFCEGWELHFPAPGGLGAPADIG